MSGRSESRSGGFLTKLAWTVFASLLFSAGLLTGLHFFDTSDASSLVAVSAEQSADSGEATKQEDETTESNGENSDDPELTDTVFSFHDRLESGAPVDRDDDESEGSEAKEAAKYTLQVAVHPKLSGAEQHMRRIRKAGLDPWVASAKSPDRGKYFRVRIGKFRSMEEARSFQKRLRKNRGIESHLNPL